MDLTKPETDVRLALYLLVTVALAINTFLVFGINQGFASAGSFDQLKATILTTKDCPTCFDLAPFKEYLTENGLSEKDIQSVDYDSFSGKKLVKRYDISQVPSVIVTGDVASFDFMSGLIENAGEIRDNAFVLTRLQPPFRDLEKNQIRGDFEAIYVTDASCKECYDVTLHQQVFERLAMKPVKETTVDIASEEGKVFVEEYVLTSVPTVLLKGDLDVYDQLQDIWSAVGTVEEDGTYVLRQGVASMGTYKRLPDGEIIVPPPAPDVEGVE